MLSSFPGPSNYVERVDFPGIDELDFGELGDGAEHFYRLSSMVGTEYTGDWLRTRFAEAQVQDPDVHDYNVGWIDAGEWLNYTRTFPAGQYHLYARLAYDQPAPFEVALDQVSGATTTNQTLVRLGTFKGTGIGGGGQVFSFVPLTDDHTNRVVLNLGGVETLRSTAITPRYNANFYMLVPAERPSLALQRSGGNVVISWYQLAGESYVLEAAPSPLGPWDAVANQSNPYRAAATGEASFFRLTKP